MNWTRTDAVRRWIVVAGLVLGPVLLVISVVINLGTQQESMRAQFDAMTANPGGLIAQSLLETLGFMFVFSALAGSTQSLRSRGGLLGTIGAAASILGIVGFSLSNASGFTLAELSQFPDHDAGFDTASALMSSGIAGTAGMVGMVFEMLGEIGILLITIGMIRARLIRIWPLIIVVAGIVVDLVGGDMVTTLAADVLLLAACCWIAVALARCSHEAWLGMPGAPAAQPAPAGD